ncbi:MAG: MBL fold metallo-hydrolase [Flavobacterium sp.]|nr:MBL fold metallo-hydrolase [Candidatus Neoflavobacterium equi]
MKIYPIESGNFKLDGGAMFGVVPKTIWNKTNPADANNLIDLAARCLLIEDGNRLVLIDTGMGSKQDDKFFSYYSLWGTHTLENSLAKHGFHKDQITDVFLTHLHFDHVGGAVEWNKDRTGFTPTFKNAKYWTNQAHLDWALQPNPREKASFLKENILPIIESGQMHYIQTADQNLLENSPLGFDILFVDGHTEKQMLPILNYKGQKLAYCADLVATAGHLPIPYVMGYDTRPLLTVSEKDWFLNQAATHGWKLLLEHDAHNEIITVQHTEKGVRLKDVLTYQDIL